MDPPHQTSTMVWCPLSMKFQPLLFFLSQSLSPSHCTLFSSESTFAVVDRGSQPWICRWVLASARRPLLFAPRPSVRCPFNYSPCLRSQVASIKASNIVSDGPAVGATFLSRLAALHLTRMYGNHKCLPQLQGACFLKDSKIDVFKFKMEKKLGIESLVIYNRLKFQVKFRCITGYIKRQIG